MLFTTETPIFLPSCSLLAHIILRAQEPSGRSQKAPLSSCYVPSFFNQIVPSSSCCPGPFKGSPCPSPPPAPCMVFGRSSWLVLNRACSNFGGCQAEMGDGKREEELTVSGAGVYIHKAGGSGLKSLTQSPESPPADYIPRGSQSLPMWCWLIVAW